MIIPVFKTGGRRLSAAMVGSTPTRFRHFSMGYGVSPAVHLPLSRLVFQMDLAGKNQVECDAHLRMLGLPQGT